MNVTISTNGGWYRVWERVGAEVIRPLDGGSVMTKYILTVAEGSPCYGGEMDDSGPVRRFEVDSPEDAIKHLPGFGKLVQRGNRWFAYRENLNGGTTGKAILRPI